MILDDGGKTANELLAVADLQLIIFISSLLLYQHYI
jgi:hypothetical protein